MPCGGTLAFVTVSQVEGAPGPVQEAADARAGLGERLRAVAPPRGRRTEAAALAPTPSRSAAACFAARKEPIRVTERWQAPVSGPANLQEPVHAAAALVAS